MARNKVQPNKLRNNRYCLRLSDDEIEMLNFICNSLNMKKCDVFRKSIYKLFDIITKEMKNNACK